MCNSPVALYFICVIKTQIDKAIYSLKPEMISPGSHFTNDFSFATPIHRKDCLFIFNSIYMFKGTERCIITEMSNQQYFCGMRKTCGILWCLSIKMPSYQYRDPINKDNAVSWPSYIYHMNPYAQKDGLSILKRGPAFLELSYNFSLFPLNLNSVWKVVNGISSCLLFELT